MILVCVETPLTLINIIILFTSCLCEDNLNDYYAILRGTSTTSIIGLDETKVYTQRTGWISCLASSGEHYHVISLQRESGLNVCLQYKFNGEMVTWNNTFSNVLGKLF